MGSSDWSSDVCSSDRRVNERLDHSLRTGAPYALTHRQRRFDGTFRWVETRLAAMRDEAGEIVQWNGVCLDIDDQIRAQDELRQAQDKLAKAGEAASLAQISASIAHEVNQPLAAIMTNAQAFQRSLTRRSVVQGKSGAVGVE